MDYFVGHGKPNEYCQLIIADNTVKNEAGFKGSHVECMYLRLALLFEVKQHISEEMRAHYNLEKKLWHDGRF